MKSSVFPVLVIIGLLGLLVLLAGLQYKWLGQISDAEQIRLEERLKDDTKRFAEDFNKIVQDAFIQFHFTSENWGSFSNRYNSWQKKTLYNQLIKDFYYVKTNNKNELLKFDKKHGEFEVAVWSGEFEKIKQNFKNEEKVGQFSQDSFALIIPIYKSGSNLEKTVGSQKTTIAVRSKNGQVVSENIIGPGINNDNVAEIVNQINLPEKEGYLILQLDERLIKEEIIPNLAEKYFSESDGGSYRISIKDKKESIVFKNHQGNLGKY